jgi:hypothetical protein
MSATVHRSLKLRLQLSDGLAPAPDREVPEMQ